MALDTKIHFRIQRKIILVSGSVHQVTAQASYRFLGSRVDHLGPHRMTHPMGRFMTVSTQIRISGHEQGRVVAAVRLMTYRTFDVRVGQLRRFFLGSIEMAAQAENGLRS
jgi:hypothetical protein